MLIEFRNIKKRYKKKFVLSDVSFGIEEGEIFGLIGQSGSGKTTLLKILTGISSINGGEVFFENKNALHNLKNLRKNIGFATQANSLFEELTVIENCFYFAKLYSIKKREIKNRLEELLPLLGLKDYENYLIRNLSGGMIKRANLLVSLIHNPRLLILDEPTAGLDPILRKSIWEYINKINKNGTTILVTSHLLDEIESNCNRIAVLKSGEVISIMSPAEYRRKFNLGPSESFDKIFEEILS